MAHFKPITRAEKNLNLNQHDMTYLSDIHTLQENNRDLAKLLADKRKENAELKEVEQKFIILENKFKIYRDLHHASLSRLEEMFNKTCSELSIVLDDLALLYTTLKEEQSKADYITEEQTECSSISSIKRLPDTLNHMTSVLNEVRQSGVEDSYCSEQCDSPNVEERGNISVRGFVPDTLHETGETFPEMLPIVSSTDGEIEKTLASNASLGETYHFSLDENFQSFVVDDETIVRRGGGESTIIMKDLDFHSSNQDITVNFAQDLDESIISRRRVSDTDKTTPKTSDENKETYSLSKITHTKHLTRDRNFDSDSDTITSTRGIDEFSQSCPTPTSAELKRSSPRSMPMSSIGTVLDSSIKEVPENVVQSSPRRFQLLNHPQRNYEENTPHKNLREDKSKHANKIKDDFIYSDDQSPKICIQRYRYFFTLGGDTSGSRDSCMNSRGSCISDAKENIGHPSSQYIQKCFNTPPQRKPLQDRKKETIIISNQNIKKSSTSNAAAPSSSEKRSWLRGPRNFDTDVAMPTSYSSFRSMRQSGPETKEREGTSKTSKASNKKSRRKPRVKKKENIRL